MIFQPQIPAGMQHDAGVTGALSWLTNFQKFAF